MNKNDTDFSNANKIVVRVGCAALIVYAALVVGFIATVAYAVKWVIS